MRGGGGGDDGAGAWAARGGEGCRRVDVKRVVRSGRVGGASGGRSVVDGRRWGRVYREVKS